MPFGQIFMLSVGCRFQAVYGLGIALRRIASLKATYLFKKYFFQEIVCPRFSQLIGI